MRSLYEVARTKGPIDFEVEVEKTLSDALLSDALPSDTAWADFAGDSVWKQVSPVRLEHFMGSRPDHFPIVEAGMVYDDDSVNVVFLVRDRYVRARAENHQDAVCLDSCVEFFFVPGMNIEQGYFNLEINCGGTMLLHYQRVPRVDSKPLDRTVLDQIQIAASMPKIVEPEIDEATAWAVACRIPLDAIEEAFPFAIDRPASGVEWRANFYKCGDETSHPHWLTWNPVAFEHPDFHRPAQFGTIRFV